VTKMETFTPVIQIPTTTEHIYDLIRLDVTFDLDLSPFDLKI